MSDKTRICSSCKTPKEPDGFPKKGAQCKACLAVSAKIAYQAKKNGGSKAKAKKGKKSTKVASPAPGLEIEQGFGLKASIDDAYLIIEQHDGESGDEDKICLSRSEFRQLVGKFSAWAA